MVDQDRQIKYINVGMEFTSKVYTKILENLEGEERQRELANMKKIMKDYIKLEHEHTVSKDVIEKIHRGLELESAAMDRDIETDYKNLLSSELKEGLDDGQVEADPRYRKLIKGGANSGDQDLLVVDENQTYIDPWLRKPISKEPVTNRVCGHTYDRDMVLKQLKMSARSQKALKCPVVGCQNNDVKQADLYMDEIIKRKIMKQAARK